MSNAEIAKAINIRYGRKDFPIDPSTVTYMFEIAQSPDVQVINSETCRYNQWEAVRNKPAATMWKGNGEDVEIKEACTLWLETLRFVRPECFLKKGLSLLPLLRRYRES